MIGFLFSSYLTHCVLILFFKNTVPKLVKKNQPNEHTPVIKNEPLKYQHEAQIFGTQ